MTLTPSCLRLSIRRLRERGDVRVHDRVEARARVGVVEDDLGERLPVEGSSCDKAVAKLARDVGECRGARLNGLASEVIVIDDPAPSSEKRSAAADLPDAMPPVRPIRSITLR